MFKNNYLKPVFVAALMLLIYITAPSNVIAGGGGGDNSYEEGPYDDCSAFEDSAYKECIFELNRAYNNYNTNNNSSSNDPNCVIYWYPGGYYAQCH